MGVTGREKKGKEREKRRTCLHGDVRAEKAFLWGNVRVLRVGGVGGGVGWVGPSACFVRGLTFNDLQETALPALTKLFKSIQ